MRDDRPSTTAMIVSFLRGIASLPGRTDPLVNDPHVAHLLPHGPAKLLRLAQRAASHLPSTRDVLQAATTPFGRHLELRTAAIDACLSSAVANGIAQVVIVGAGLDARAWRLTHLPPCAFWEIDHPATQALKRTQAEQLPQTPHRVHFAAVDFEHETLEAPLRRAGHDETRPSFWIWEGVTMYLHPDAIRETLCAISRCSAPGSRLAMTYLRPDYATMPAWLQGPAHRVFDQLGEPLRGAMPREALAALLDAAGFALVEEHGVREWASSHGRRRPRLAMHERLAIADRMR